MGNKLININLSHNIDGVILTSLKQIRDERGAVFHFLRSDSKSYKGFGESYFSLVNEAVVKGWKYHKEISQNFCVPYGAIKFVIYDNRVNSNTKGNIQEVTLDDNENYILLTMPPGLWYSFKCLSNNVAILSNIIDFPHSINESISLPLNSIEIPYVWS